MNRLLVSPLPFLTFSLLLCWVLGGCGSSPPPISTADDESILAAEMESDDVRAAPTFGANLIKNGGFEKDTGGDGTQDIDPRLWTRTGPVTVILYGAPGGFPDLLSPGPPKRGRNFVAGGPDSPKSYLVQRIDLSWAAAVIQAKKAKCICTAYLGGYGSQDDTASISLIMQDEAGYEITQAPLIGPNAYDRNDQTGLWRCRWSGILPKRTRAISVQARFNRDVGPYNDGYIDSVSLLLKNMSPAVGSPAADEG